MSGGGGGGSVLPPVTNNAYTDPVSGKTFTDATGGTDALNAEIADRQAQEKAASDAAQAAADAKVAQQRTDFNTARSTAKTTANQSVLDYFRNNGVDPTAYQPQIDARIGAVDQSVPDLAANPISVYGDNLGSSILNDLTNGVRNQKQDAVSSLFGSHYAESALPDTLKQPAISDILTGMFDPLSAGLTNAQKRGTLNQTGYDSALKALGTAQQTGTSALGSLADNILTGDRSNINDYISGAKNTAAGLNLNTAGSFDPNFYYTGAQSKVGDYTNNFEGDVRNALGDTSFTDLSSLLNAGGAVQGATNPSVSNPAGGTMTPAMIAEQALQAQKRGLGTVGAF